MTYGSTIRLPKIKVIAKSQKSCAPEMTTHSGPGTDVGNASFAESDHDGCAFGFDGHETSPGTAGNPGGGSAGTLDAQSHHRTGTAGTSAARKKQGRSAWKHPKANDHGKSTEGHHAAHQVRPKKGE